MAPVAKCLTKITEPEKIVDGAHKNSSTSQSNVESPDTSPLSTPKTNKPSSSRSTTPPAAVAPAAGATPPMKSSPTDTSADNASAEASASSIAKCDSSLSPSASVVTSMKGAISPQDGDQKADNKPSFSSRGGRNRGVPPPPRDDDDRKVFVGNLPRNVNEDDLKTHFATAGDVESVRLIRNYMGANKRFAFVVYKENDSRDKAAQQLHDQEFNENKLIVQVIVPKDQLPEKVSGRSNGYLPRRPRRRFNRDRVDNENQGKSLPAAGEAAFTENVFREPKENFRENSSRRPRRRVPRRPRNSQSLTKPSNNVDNNNDGSNSASSTAPQWGSEATREGGAQKEERSSSRTSSRPHGQIKDGEFGTETQRRPRFEDRGNGRFQRRFNGRGPRENDDGRNENNERGPNNEERDVDRNAEKPRDEERDHGNEGRFAQGDRPQYRRFNAYRGPRRNNDYNRNSSNVDRREDDGNHVNMEPHNIEYATNDNQIGRRFRGDRGDRGDDMRDRRGPRNYNDSYYERRSGGPSSNYPPRPRQEKPRGKKSETGVFVANLSFKVSDESLREFFTKDICVPVEAYVVRNGSHSRGFGFVEFENHQQQQYAIEHFDKLVLIDRQVTVRVALMPESGAVEHENQDTVASKNSDSELPADSKNESTNEGLDN